MAKRSSSITKKTSPAVRAVKEQLAEEDRARRKAAEEDRARRKAVEEATAETEARSIVSAANDPQTATEAVQQRVIQFNIPEKLSFLTELHRYKVVYGGRGGAKSHSIGRALLGLGTAQPLRILCTREIQKSIKESVHNLLKTLIEEMKLDDFYEVLDTEIRGRNGTVFIFSGLHGHTIHSIKSYEGVDVVWVEEAHTVSAESWRILIPTIREENSEIWVSFNPDLDSDPAYQMFVVNPPPNAIVVEMNYDDNPWFPPVLEMERRHAKRTMLKDDYENIWLGKCRSVVAGAIYATEVRDLIESRRARPMPYDPRFVVHTIWDLGWNDKMTVIMVQKPFPTTATIIDYYEDSHKTYAEVIGDLEKKRYRWGTDHLPHDGKNKNPITGTSAEMTLKKLGRRKVKVLDKQDPDEGIRQTRMMFSRLLIDDTMVVNGDGGFRGAGRLIQCAKNYKRAINVKTSEPGDPVHDQYSHGMDALRGLSQVVDQLTNPQDDFAEKMPVVAPYSNPVDGTGVLG